jgi:hypothetical protein
MKAANPKSKIQNPKSTYPGGKGLLYQRLISLIPPHDTYIEAFAGGGAVARNKRPARVNIAIDLDGEALANLRSAIVRNGVGYPGPLAESGEPEARGSGVSPDAASVAAIAANGGAAQRDPLAGSGEGFDTFRSINAGNGEATRLASPGHSWQFLNTDALAWLASYPWRGDEFVYLDPPYLLETRRQHRRLYRYELERADHERLLAILLWLPCPVMVSGYWSRLYADYLSSWHTATFETITRGGKPATEWVWMNYPAPVALHDYRYLGDGFRERERIKRKIRRWVEKLRKMDILEKQAILAAIEEAGL